MQNQWNTKIRRQNYISLAILKKNKNKRNSQRKKKLKKRKFNNKKK